MADIEIEIDGQKLTAKPNQTVIQVADDAGIYIPRFCYHKHLSIPANCRMCLVEVEKAPKALPACATPVAPGMKIFTKSSKTIAAQRAVMEFLLINHPLDCPICDQGGECELQDLSMGYGSSWSQYEEKKRSVADQDLGPLIATEMTRCIYCTRCVRFGDEIAGIRELGAIGRGEFTEISTYIQHAVQSEVSGNIIDLCPVGALTNKPYRFTARPWELEQAPSVSPHDCVGSNVNVHTRYGRVMRVVARENRAINDTWIADRDRFSFTGLYHPDRLAKPRVKVEGEWQTMDWQHALLQAASGLQETLAVAGADQLGALASPSSTLEEFYLLQKLVRALGSPHVDHRLRECGPSTDTAFRLQLPIIQPNLTSLAECDAIIILGSNIQKEQPIVAVQVRKAAKRGVPVHVINCVDYDFNFAVTSQTIVAPHQLLETLQQEPAFIKTLADHQRVGILVGAQILHHPQSHRLYSAVEALQAKLKASTCWLLTDGANSLGGFIAGAVPYPYAGFKNHSNLAEQTGLNAYEMMANPRKAYLLLNVEPDADFANSAQAIAAIKAADFVVALSQFSNPVLEAHADVILPVGPFTETSGTFVNAAGTWQSFKGVAQPFEQSRPAWKVLTVLAKFFLLDGFEFDSSEAVKHELTPFKDQPFDTNQAAQQADEKPNNEVPQQSKLTRIGEIPLYAGDALVRRAGPLQEMQAIMEGEIAMIRLHPETAKTYGLASGDWASVQQPGTEAVVLPVSISERIAKDAVWLAGGISQTSQLGDLFGEITIKKHERLS